MSAGAKTILVFLEAGHAIGLGHAIRVAGILRLLGSQHRVAIAGGGAQLDAMFPQARRLPPAAPAALAALLAGVAPDLVLVDRPGLDAAWWQALDACARDIPIALIDDYGGTFPADLVINGTVLEQYHHYSGLRPAARVLAGAQYALVRPQFARQPWLAPAERSLLIVAGGGDAARDWALWLVSGALPLASWGRVGMIVGAAFPQRDALARACARHGVALESGVPAERMAQALSQAALALTTGGMIVYEAVAAGVPALVFPQMDNLVDEAAWFAAQGAVADLGAAGGMDARALGGMVAQLLARHHERIAMSHRQRALVDGQGMLRAARAIGQLLEGAPA
jgi:spore coat polysaccharide biosynthesis predicted glycosyltransferase SpsG